MRALHRYFFGAFEAFGAALDVVFTGVFPAVFLPDLAAVPATAFGLAAVFGFFSTVSAALGLAAFLAAGLLTVFFEPAFGLAFGVPTLSSLRGGVAVAFALTGFLAG